MEQDAPKLYEMEPTQRFSDRVGDYVRFRPGYPTEAVDAVLEGLGAPERVAAADVGAGTGIFSRLLGDRGVRVVAIEPNEQMRGGATPHPRVEYRGGTAEATGLADGSVDLVVSAQAFHWFEPEGALAEFRRILRPGGRAALLWNDRDVSDPLTAEYGVLIRHASGYHPAAEDRGVSSNAIERSELFENARLLVFRYEQRLTLEGLIGRARSASYCPTSGPRLDRLIEGLTDLHRRHAGADGTAAMVYRTRVYMAEAGRG